MKSKTIINQLDGWQRVVNAKNLQLEHIQALANEAAREQAVRLREQYKAEKARADAAEERERILKQAIWELIK
ncbi:hypothetical protein M5W68_18450 [Paenibacillus larvae]|uniref:hypothetical protein n=1 Tax=Paenibacillus larvae TaxID=1464 RepID=UPI00228139A5|nr:hypothetical protein [Paenibacillus larvae]MCY9527033.1 hypothetical protein [Paenibacillus larvae]